MDPVVDHRQPFNPDSAIGLRGQGYGARTFAFASDDCANCITVWKARAPLNRGIWVENAKTSWKRSLSRRRRQLRCSRVCAAWVA